MKEDTIAARPLALSDRVALAEKLHAARLRIAEEVTAEFLRRHPDWVTRYGERAAQLGREDAVFHISFLTGAVESGNARSFEDYARWTCGMLNARGIEPRFVQENLEQIGQAVAPLLSEAESEWVAGVLRAGLEGCRSVAAGPVQEAPAMALTQSLYLQAILRGERKAALQVALEALKDGTLVRDLYVDVLQWALYEVGRLWEANRISVAEEHLATAITQHVIAQLYSRLPSAEPGRGRMVVTGIEGEIHQVGANMVADVLESDGWDLRFLGTNMPHAGILKAVAEHKAEVLGISCTMLFNLPKVVDLVRAVRAADPSVRIVLGGGAFRSAPGLAQEIGADGFAGDLREAIAVLRPLARSAG